MKILVIYYSRSGRTKKIAKEINAKLGGDMDEVRDVVNRQGLVGWLRAGRDAGTKKLTEIKTEMDPSEYDLVVIGSPTWNGTVSTPVRTYITNNQEKLSKVASFTTGEGEEPTALEEITRLLGDKIIAKLHLVRKLEIDTDNYLYKLQGFLEKIDAVHKRLNL